MALPAADLVVLEGTGHNPMWDRAGAFNRVALDFLGAGAQAICRHFTAALARAGLPRTIPLP